MNIIFDVDGVLRHIKNPMLNNIAVRTYAKVAKRVSKFWTGKFCREIPSYANF